MSATILSFVLLCALPHSAYYQYQSLTGTLFDNLKWIYERATFDPTPVDVAIFGPSRGLLGLSADAVEQQIPQATPHVANMSLLETGRDVHWTLINLLLAHKQPKEIVLTITEEPPPWGHEAYKYIAPVSDVLDPPSVFLHNVVYNVSFLPFRQAKLAVGTLFPETFGFQRRFSSEVYAHERRDFTVTHVQGDGVLIDMDKVNSAEALDERLRRFNMTPRTKVPRAVAKYVEADDSLYVKRIADLARARGVKLRFIYMPMFRGHLPEATREAYAQYGPVLDLGDLSSDPALYFDEGHLNHRGAMLASARLGQAIAKDLQTTAAAGQPRRADHD